MDILLILLIALVIVFLFFNIYTRKELLSSFKKLQRAGVEFELRHIFNKELREEQVHTQYPEHVENIEQFSRQIRRSIRYALIIFITIGLLGIVIVKLS